ncbi:MAG TPA: T9SS type A sorting domain-containing protein [Bacteroidales bacterium]|nr:T9SS type A sorting domain-containing protein [Bacteroidales bacterium]
MIVDQNVSINALTINSLAAVTINPTFSLTVSGTLTIKSNASGTGSLITNGSVSGNIVAERYFPGASEQWHLVSSPVSGQAISGDWTPTGGYTDGSGYDFYAWYEAGQLWVNRKNTTTNNQGDGPRFDEAAVNGNLNFNPARGYITAFQAANPTKSFTGAPFNTTQTYTLSRSGTGSYVGLNLVGNPFPATIAGNNNADLSNNFLAANASQLHDTAVAYYILNNGNYTAINQASVANFIAVGQGFFVVAKNNGDTLSFNTNIRKHGSSTFYKNSDERNALKIQLQASGGKSDATELYFHSDMTTALDPGYDAAKLTGFSGVNVYSKLVAGGSTKFDIQSLPLPNDQMIIPLGINVTEAGTYNLTFEPTALYQQTVSQTYLLDKLTNSQIQINPGTTYGFNTAIAGDISNRFELRFGALGLNDRPTTPPMLAYYTQGTLHLLNTKGSTTVQCFDLQGRLIVQQNTGAADKASLTMDLKPGIYLIRVHDDYGIRSSKVVIN